ncbi:mRNA export factor MEX67 [Madurella mycetomatis]|uniref:mRNA export factor MEX67 n=1 Tax=Madurella mycetomatis TaxID=100816 RepID=A0A175W9X1_9PEZI|nr:mRNA export factor MEX67 [Madurella mycetomatis]
MAPPSGRGRGAPRGARRPRAGGVTKRRSTPMTDKDGDILMDSEPANAPTGPSGNRGRGRGRGHGRGAARDVQTFTRLAQNINYHLDSQDSKKPQFDKTTMKILGLKGSKAAGNPDGGLRSLLDFLERKASRDKRITLGRGIIAGDYVWVKVNKDDAPHLLRLNGYTFAGAELAIQETSDPMPTADSTNSRTATAETKQKLLSVLASRYNAEQKLLDLSALGADQTLGSMGTFGSQALAEKSFKALVHLAGSEYKDPEVKREAIQAVSLARNEIQDVDQVFTLAKSLPHLRRLDLSGNKLENLSKLSKWRDEFRFLEELHLSGNPVTSQPNYATELFKWFPCLQNLDGQLKFAADRVAQDDSLKAQMILELSRQTGMNAQYSELCLTGVANWNFEMALKSFEEQKANLPRDAFITPIA